VKTAVVIPAYNEELRIAQVLGAVTRAGCVHEVIVVSDGSDDRTVEVASMFPNVNVIDLDANVGKGGAMWAGVQATDAEVVVFFDADLVGLLPEHVERLVDPMLHGADMTVGIFKQGKFWSDAAQAISPSISGQRAVRREILLANPRIADARMGVEVELTRIARSQGLDMVKVPLWGLTHTSKEKKFGFVEGAARRAKMYAEIGKAIVRGKRP
jgi:glycosyltransferase involved in cell wall biosynthesis